MRLDDAAHLERQTKLVLVGEHAVGADRRRGRPVECGGDAHRRRGSRRVLRGAVASGQEMLSAESEPSQDSVRIDCSCSVHRQLEIGDTEESDSYARRKRDSPYSCVSEGDGSIEIL